MNVGMLWLDDDRTRSLDEKVSRAVDYYREKYGRMPDLCLVNKTMLAEEKLVGKVSVQPQSAILPHHFWVGMRAS
ncbi:MAG: hypothetical protein H6654_00375 [Ardenticatenaceae bacterium]|nr:hypothetical protein [Anaerolineales bacterium]MCB8940655.1 hypothetical protein [Ardenticatenaceae bacterium]MCB8971985.1 hypothetical protein [Ardenticatenaceae bacterium]